MNKRPLSVSIIAILYLAVGIFGFVFHFRESLAAPREGVWIELTEILAILCGVYLLRGRNWARWLTVAWIAFHVALSVYHLREFAIHALFCAVIIWLLFRRDAAKYFGGARVQPA
jgi:hypothetical protein